MIHNLVSSIGFRLDEFLKNKLSISEDSVVISSLVDMGGNMNQEIENKITVFLINIEEEKITKNGQFQSMQGMAPPVTINIYLMFTAYFPNFNYIESLRYISLVIEFFQNYNTFNNANTPLLSNNIDKLHAEFYNIDINEVSRFWGGIGTNYIPSVAYKIKHLRFDGNVILENIPRVTGNQSNEEQS